ncbi:hypothetical protein [Chryseobacterium foetidum]|uniref:hypothetical protein n=1 Tax=Chryseobacterium foetidum TaxID=2951057 RepID=UPI0021C63598|nr:hypothetical protein [Chryseobacterium foetidum]
MKKLIFSTLLSLGLLLPVLSYAAEISKTTTSELTNLQQKKKKSKSRKNTAKKTASKGCTYNGYTLNVGPRGGCFYYSGNSKEYVDRSYCSGCN